MSDHPLSRIPLADANRAYGTLTSAYREDPVQRWLFPEDDSYAREFPSVLAAVGGTAFTSSTAWRLNDERAVSLWLPPGVEPQAEQIGTTLFEKVPAEQHPEMFSVLEQIEEVRPKYSHWYLPWIGVEPGSQGHGLGGALLAACLEYVDLGGLPVHLLASNPRTIPFFERHGFVVTGEAREGSAPPFAVMLREGRHA